MRWISFALACLLGAACGSEHDTASEPPPDIIQRSDESSLAAEAVGDETVFRVNVGGPALSGTPSWTADTSGSPSPYGNASVTGSQTYAVSTAINTSDPSVPVGTPATLFQTERWDPAGGSEMQWNFPVLSGATYEVRLYFAEIYSGTMYAGARKFDVYIEGALVANDLDVYAAVGGYKGLVKTYTVTMSNTNLDIDFTHVVENPSLEGIEIIKKAGGGTQPPPSTGVSFGKSLLQGESSGAPTSLQFGPDNKLYVADVSGVIKVYSLKRNGANSYSVTGTQTITSIQSIPNHNDNGALNTGVTGRLVTGLLVAGTASNPVIYVTSSDPRIGGGATGDLNVDTNSGILSRLTWTGTSWAKKDLVRGLPRSEENHASNGMALANGILYIAQGGHTNMGAPSKNFVYTPEYALSAAILKVNLGAIGETTYDLPTLDDESRSGTFDAGDPFGGNGGKNQAKLVSGGPVQVHAPGFRNAYDVVITAAGKMYTIDNGSNAGWGDVPVGEGTAGTCTNGVKEPGVTYGDGLHYVAYAGYYGGHPNPTRANTNNKFNGTNPQSPVSFGNAVECDFRTPTAAGSLVVFPSSTNGIAEYTASNFGGAMKGNLLAAGYVYNTLYRLILNSTGTAVSSNQALFSNVGKNPLDVVALGDAGPFPGTIWVADMGSGQIVVFEPGDYGSSTPPPSCSGADYVMLDEDADGYDNADEIDNKTNPCSAADVPPDADKDLTSNLNDPDDDNDGWSDTSDPFAIDAQNGKTRTPNFLFEWTGGTSTGILGLGFTGLMTNGFANYESLFNTANLTAGGAAGVLTVDAVPAGDAYQTANSQQYAFQVGVNASPTATGPFTVHTRIMAPFLGLTPTDFQSMGLFVGNGDQDNYVKLVVSANGGLGGIQLLKESGGAASNSVMASQTFPGPEHADLYLRVDPAAATITASYTVKVNGVTSARKTVGTVTVPTTWFTATNRGLALGVIATSVGSGKTFPATWDFLEATPDQPSGTTTLAHDDFGRTVSGGWGSADLGGSWSVLSGSATDFYVSSGAGQVSSKTDGVERIAALTGVSARDVDLAANLSLSTAPASGELFSYLLLRRQSGGAYYRVGLRVTPTGKIYLRGQTNAHVSLFSDADSGLVFTPGAFYRLRVRVEGANPTRIRARAWKTGTIEPSNWTVDVSNSASGLQQAGSVGVRMVNGSSTNVVAKADAFDAVAIGSVTPPPPPPPTGGWATLAATGLARQEVSFTAAAGKLYLGGGGTTAHQAYNPATNTWTYVSSLPLARDHMQSVVVNGEIYYIGGLTSWPSPAVGTVNIYNPSTNSWRTGAPMPRPRGAGGVAVFNGRIYYAGGLSGGVAVNWFDRYDPATNAWLQGPNMPTARDHFHAAVVGTKFYAIGGRNVSIGAMTTVNQAYDYYAGTWSSRAPLPTARGGFGVAAVNGEIYVIGGEASNTTFNKVEIYTPGTNLWRTGPSMPTARHGIQAAVYNGKIYIAAGGTIAGSGGATQTHEVLTP